MNHKRMISEQDCWSDESEGDTRNSGRNFVATATSVI